MPLPRQPGYQTTFDSTKPPRTPQAVPQDDVAQPYSCLEDKLWERDICSGSKTQQAQP